MAYRDLDQFYVIIKVFCTSFIIRYCHSSFIWTCRRGSFHHKGPTWPQQPDSVVVMGTMPVPQPTLTKTETERSSGWQPLYWRHWSLTSTLAVNARTVYQTAFVFQCKFYPTIGREACERLTADVCCSRRSLSASVLSKNLCWQVSVQIIATQPGPGIFSLIIKTICC